jgi:pyridoxamine 5'-phosphate oxidase
MTTVNSKDATPELALPDRLPGSPLGLLRLWLDQAQAQSAQRNPWAMTLATVEPDGRPSARVVLCRDYDQAVGHVVFYTNSRSRKGIALERTPYAAAVFHWDALERQVRIEGPVTRSPDSESDAYFASRPRAAQIAAWASDQSQPILSRAALLSRLSAEESRFSGIERVPRPPHWGGYRLSIERIEFWVGLADRVHDRALWIRSSNARWTASRLQP